MMKASKDTRGLIEYAVSDKDIPQFIKHTRRNRVLLFLEFGKASKQEIGTIEIVCEGNGT